MKNFTFTLAALLFTLGSHATVITVDNKPNSPADYSDLQTAVDSSNSGDTLYIQGSPTSYGGFSIDHQLTLIGAGYDPANQWGLKSEVGLVTLTRDDPNNPTTNANGTKIIGLDMSRLETNLYGPHNIYVSPCINAFTGDGQWALINSEFEQGVLKKGTLISTSQEIYAGEFNQEILAVPSDNKASQSTHTYTPLLTGFGMKTDMEGNVYRGEFNNGKLNGEGEITFTSGRQQLGEFVDDKLHGNGKVIKDDDTFMQGTFRDGQPHGDLTYETKDGNTQTYTFENGENVDQEYIAQKKQYEQKKEELREKLGEVYKADYEQHLAKQEQKAKLVNSALFGATMGGMASTMGADDLTAFEFGVAVFSDSYQGTSTNIDNFKPTLQGFNNIAGGPDKPISNYKKMEAFTRSANKIGINVADAFDWEAFQDEIRPLLDGAADAFAGVSAERRQQLEDMYGTPDTEEKTQGRNSDQDFQMPDCDSGEPLPKGWRCLGKKGRKAPFRIDVPELIGKWKCVMDAHKYGYIIYHDDGSGEIKYCSGHGCAESEGYSVKQFEWGVVPDKNGKLNTFENLTIIQDGAPTQSTIAKFEKSGNRIKCGVTAYKK